MASNCILNKIFTMALTLKVRLQYKDRKGIYNQNLDLNLEIAGTRTGRAARGVRHQGKFSFHPKQ